ncbi:MAG: hypothetical protein WDM78_23320 [Puia sp.]
MILDGKVKLFVEAREPITTIPFVKNHEFNYSKLLPTALRGATWIFIYRNRHFYYNSSIQWR